VTSPTGTGKTLAFAIPMMGKWSIDPFGVFGLVLTPTRELAYQIRDQFCLLATNVSVCTIVGGVDMQTQGLEMQRRPSFIVATPGRLADHMETNREMCQSIFRQTRYLVIDEADRILDGQFDKQLAPIREHLPSGVQILLFSATMTENLKEITGVLMGNNKPFIYDPTGLVEEKTLLQRVVPCPVDFKDGYLIEILRSVRDGEFAISKTIGSTIIFATTNRECEVLQILLDELGFMNVTLHSLMPQRARAHALAQFKSSCVPILIATDIASRGLDILAVDLVINYSVPMPVDYVHRIGRAGRGCRKGIAITFVTPRDCKFIQNVVSYTQTDLTEYIVDESKVLKVLQEVMAAKKAAELNVEEYDVFRERRENYKRKREMLEESSSDSDDSSISSTDDYDSPPADAELKSRKVSAKPKQQQTKSP
jgi:ATP-dependent RNA helicase DDX49/DBP8